MVATATGVKNWCQFTFISYYVKIPSRVSWRVYINEITSALRAEVIQICLKMGFNYSHSIVALGFGDMS